MRNGRRLRWTSAAMAAALLAGCGSAVPDARRLATSELPAPTSAPQAGGHSDRPAGMPDKPTAAEPDDVADDEDDVAEEPGDAGTEGLSVDELVAFADGLTAALTAADPDAWANNFTTDLQQDAERWFSSVQAVPMSMREMHVTSRTRAQTEAGATRAVLAFRHQIAGVDKRPLMQRYEVQIAATADGGTEVTTWSPLEDLPWDWDGELVVRESDVAVLLVDEESGWAVDEVFSAVELSMATVQDELPGTGSERILLSASDASTIDPQGVLYLYGASEVSQIYNGLARFDGEMGHRVFADIEVLLDEADYYGHGAPLPTAAWFAVLSQVEDSLGSHSGVEWAWRALAMWHDEAAASWPQALDTDFLTWAYLDYYGEIAEELPEQLPPAGWTFYTEDADLSVARDVTAMLIYLYLVERHGEPTATEVVWQLALTAPRAASMEPVISEALGVSLEELEQEFVAWVADQWDG